MGCFTHVFLCQGRQTGVALLPNPQQWHELLLERDLTSPWTQQGRAGVHGQRLGAGSRVSCLSLSPTHHSTGTNLRPRGMQGSELSPQFTIPDLRSSKATWSAMVTSQESKALSQVLVLGRVACLQSRAWESELGQMAGAAGSPCA